jgi:cytochrome c oxidase cbb3-type subunit I/II
MPSFAWLADTRLHPRETADKLLALQRIGVPYTNDDIDRSEATVKAQATRLSAELAVQGVKVEPLTEMVALIAYLQRLGRDTGVSLEPLPLVGGAAPAGAVGGGR